MFLEAGVTLLLHACLVLCDKGVVTLLPHSVLTVHLVLVHHRGNQHHFLSTPSSFLAHRPFFSPKKTQKAFVNIWTDITEFPKTEYGDAFETF